MPALIVLRGNSASGKSSVAAEIRRRHHDRDLAIVGQDAMRRDVMRERDEPGGANIGLIGLVARYALDHGYHTIVEGILYAAHYADMLAALVAGHAGLARCYYLEVPFDETLRRHATKPKAAEYGAREMRSWYRERDFLPGGTETVIPADSTLDETVTRIMADTSLGRLANSRPPLLPLPLLAPLPTAHAAPPIAPPRRLTPAGGPNRTHPPSPARSNRTLPQPHPPPAAFPPTAPSPSRLECAYEPAVAGSIARLSMSADVYGCAFELARTGCSATRPTAASRRSPARGRSGVLTLTSQPAATPPLGVTGIDRVVWATAFSRHCRPHDHVTGTGHGPQASLDHEKLRR